MDVETLVKIADRFGLDLLDLMVEKRTYHHRSRQNLCGWAGLFAMFPTKT